MSGSLRNILGESPCIVVAHPDDETLWAGGLVLKNNDLDWSALCCSIPRIDPIRAWDWHMACQKLGINRTLLCPFQETSPDTPLECVPIVRGASCIVTHGMQGEYGHAHHRQIHWMYTDSSTVPVLCFNVGQSSEYTIVLSDEEFSAKMAALKSYHHGTVYPPLGSDVPKWEALLHRYGTDERRTEGFDLAPEKYQWKVLTDIINENGYKSGAELGVRFGQTSRYILIHTESDVIGVDLMMPQPENTGEGQETYESWPWDAYENAVIDIENEFPDRFTMYRLSTDEASMLVEDGSLDWVFIDADHSYEGVRADITNWLPKIRKGGMITGHDIDRKGVRDAVRDCLGDWEDHGKRWNNCWIKRV